MEIDSNITENVWDLISQFVCWEFCRNAKHFFSQSSAETRTDLLTFFRDMVIQMTTKHSESDMTKYEIIAKLIEEFNAATSPEHFQIALKLTPVVKKVCPELKSAVQELQSHLEMMIHELPPNETIKDLHFLTLMNKFCDEACRLLPPPDILKAYSTWQKECEHVRIVVNDDTVMERLKKELVSENVPEILSLIKSDDLYKLHANEDKEEYLIQKNLDVSKEKSAEDCFLSFESTVSSTFEDCDSTCARKNAESSACMNNITHFYDNISNSKPLIPIKDCNVILIDVLKDKNPEIKQYVENTEVP